MNTNQYAIFQPVLDRFLLVSNNLESVKKTTWLVSSRYRAYVCDIVDNMQSISSSNCRDFRPGDIHAQTVLQLDFENWPEPVKITSLKPADKPIDWHNIDMEITWLALLHHWARFLIDMEQGLEIVPFDLIPKFINDGEIIQRLTGMRPEDLEQIQNFKQQANKLLYLGRSPDQTQQRMIQLIANHPIIFNFYSSWPDQSNC